MTLWPKLVTSIIALALIAGILLAWRDARQQQTALQAELKSAHQALADATARQSTRDAALNTLVAQLQRQKAKVQTPAQAIAALPQVLPLPQPITFDPGKVGLTPQTAQPDSSAPREVSDTAPDTPKSNAAATLPAGELKPLYDFAVDCKACQAQLAAIRADLKDEQAKTQALSRERDDALRAARGGSVFRRVARAAKWFLIGAAAGAISAKAIRR